MLLVKVIRPVLCDSVLLLSLWLFLMQSVLDDGERIVFIKNISPTEAGNLREALKKISYFRNYLPLLNKVQTNENMCYSDLTDFSLMCMCLLMCSRFL